MTIMLPNRSEHHRPIRLVESPRPVHRSPRAFALRLVLVAGALLLAAGCTTVYVPRYADSGVYYDDPYQESTHYPTGPSHGYDRAWAVNPVYYPYWSLDYFYFSQYYHPYSVVVSSWDPYYYPYPGWRYGPRHRHHGGFGVSISFGDPWYGYPWHGYGWGWRPVHYGYFGSAWYGHGGYGYGGHYGYHHDRDRPHPVHRGNDRLRALQRREEAASRNVLLSQRAGRLSGARYVPERPPLGRANQPYKRGELRTDPRLERRASLRNEAVVGRGGGESRIDRGAAASGRNGSESMRSSLRSSIRSNDRLAAPSERAPIRSVPSRPSLQRSEFDVRDSAPVRGRIDARSGRFQPRSSPPRREVPHRSAPAPRSVIQPLRIEPRRVEPAHDRGARRSVPRAESRAAPRPSAHSAPPPRAQSRPNRSMRSTPPRSAVRSAPRPARSVPRPSGGRDGLRSRRDSGGRERR